VEEKHEKSLNFLRAADISLQELMLLFFTRRHTRYQLIIIVTFFDAQKKVTKEMHPATCTQRA